MKQTTQLSSTRTRVPQATRGILDKNFVYRNASSTDITITWRKFGWNPVERKESKQ